MNRLFIVYCITESGSTALHNIFTALLQAVEEAERIQTTNNVKAKVQMISVDYRGMHVRKTCEI